MTELLPCPFCGSDPQRYLLNGEHEIHCGECGAGRTSYDAVENDTAWNRRTSSQQPSPASQARTEGVELPIDRETLGRMVREAWVRWAQTQPNPKHSWLIAYDDMAEHDKEADRQIGEAVCKWTVIHYEARAALAAPPSPAKE